MFLFHEYYYVAIIFVLSILFIEVDSIFYQLGFSYRDVHHKFRCKMYWNVRKIEYYESYYNMCLL